ncbi:hypothetical protein Nhal_2514 [Nitrosococcus halophilus Nc 4]|uniref:Tetratricopeptide repeat protein n=1 Tax=Nitrosococcus halophilus (strain Nc4) TaxID=472759 RepID=D5BWE2_NITHN|nr:tetratricopeptide repeat protein [Nitrosococcus halophilus]ADE15599.1 hypothetical protein Nhal_2514 [Nitrosococcus halophilus Nc 4]
MRKKRKSQTARQSIDVLAAQAESHLQAGRFREAMDAYKQLLKREQRPPWREALADAYLGRAEQLAAKSMYKEAAVLWENMASLCGDRHLDRYVDWLLQAGRFGRGARLFAEADTTFRDSPAGRRLAARLAGLLLCGYEEIAESLPSDSPLLPQRDNMLAAMEAYCRGDAAAMKEKLKAIPFRSPYRDLRLILQGLAALAAEPKAVLAQLDKVPANSPFARFAQVVRTVTLEDKALLEAVSQLQEPERKLVLTLKGWGEEQIDLIHRLPDVRQAGAKELFRFALSGGQFENSSLKHFCLELLPHYPQGLSTFEKRFGPLPPFERERIQALGAERRRDPMTAKRHWGRCVEELTVNGAKGEKALQAALILRHMADLAIQELPPWDEEVAHCLAKSLELDQDDKPTYLRLMDIARQQDDRKAQDRWVEQAVRQFPEDPEVLMAAGRGAYRRAAFKKAAGFARALLERDPINPHARNLLISCHLAHARKQIKAGKHQLAEQELTAAEGFSRQADQRGIVALNRGFVALLQGSEQEGETLLQEGLRELGGGLVAQFRFLVDGHRLGIAQRTLTRHYNRIKGKPPSPTSKDIVLLAELLHRYSEDGVKKIPEILERLRKPLKAAARLDFSEQELQAILVALEKVGHYLLLKDYAGAALDRFGQQPRFLYYYVLGRTKGRQERMTVVDHIQLQTGLEQALEAEDHQTAALIGDFLGMPALMPSGVPPLPLELDEVIRELMDFLDTDNPQEVLDFIEEQMEERGEFPPFPLPFPKGKPK